jgi:hypothetical protein
MIAKLVRIGTPADPDAWRRQDLLAMTPSERVRCLIGLRDRQFGATARPIRGSGLVSFRGLPHFPPR